MSLVCNLFEEFILANGISLTTNERLRVLYKNVLPMITERIEEEPEFCNQIRWSDDTPNRPKCKLGHLLDIQPKVLNQSSYCHYDKSHLIQDFCLWKCSICKDYEMCLSCSRFI
jgi:hypothetical protein